MQDALLTVFFSIVGPFLGGLGGSLVALMRIRQRCTSLEWAVGDLQQRASSFKGKEMAEKRWSKEKAFDAEMAQVLHGATPPRKRYDNDPLGD
jgi:hypothetical protein